MDKTTHEIIKMHLKESETGTVNLTLPNVWMEAKPAVWMNE